MSPLGTLHIQPTSFLHHFCNNSYLLAVPFPSNQAFLKSVFSATSTAREIWYEMINQRKISMKAAERVAGLPAYFPFASYSIPNPPGSFSWNKHAFLSFLLMKPSSSPCCKMIVWLNMHFLESKRKWLN